MTILGVDPGIASTGFGVIRVGEDEEIKLVDSGVITTDARTPHDGRLRFIYQSISELINFHKPDAVAVEGIFYSKNLKSLAEVSEAIGVIILAAGNYGIRVKKFTPLEVKSSITGFGKAEKRQVQHMVRSMLKLEGSQKAHHASDALAVAICYKNFFC